MALPVNTKYNLQQAGLILWYLLLLFFAWLMWLITLQYIPARRDAAFLNVKLEVVDLLPYRIAFFTHVYSSMFVLVAGMIQFNGYMRQSFPALHRYSGRIYVSVILLLSGPTGLIMGYYGNGGIVAQTGFCLLAVLWLIFTYKGYAAIRSRNMPAHRKWMYRSYALTLSAISLRLWKWGLVYLLEPRPMDLYQVTAWLGWTGNLLIAELLIYKFITKTRS